MKIGTRVRMSKALKKKFRENGSHAHVREFGDSVGVVIPKDPGIAHWPEVEVEWGDTKLHYLYLPEELDIVE